VTFVLFLAAATVIALSPGPGLLYVAARTLAGGWREGVASTLGTGLGGLILLAAGALGVSALVLASAEAFTVLKIAGALYLVWLGFTTIRGQPLNPDEVVAVTGTARAFRDGVLIEALNPKTAAFFLAFLPQFIDPAAGPAWLQFCLLGIVSVILNTLADLGVALLASRARTLVMRRNSLMRRLQQGAGLAIAGLGLWLLFARRPAAI
jgi:threonine/homoserine/homoserine lactone efflux protein